MSFISVGFCFANQLTSMSLTPLKFKIRDGKLLPPFVSVTGLGATGGLGTSPRRRAGKEFISIEEFAAACPRGLEDPH